MLSKVYWLVLGIILLIVDQLSKYIVSHTGVRLFLNDRFAFSLPVPTVLMYSIYTVTIAVIMWYVYKRYNKFTVLEKIAWTLILAGSLSNIGERIIFGKVKDFIPLFNGILNVADFYIIGGVILLLIHSYLIPPEKI